MKVLWNEFVDRAKNATFLFNRDYMDYHSNRFTDASLMVFQGQAVVCLLPANRLDDKTACSHAGLTYGGFVLRRSETLCGALNAMRACLAYLEANGTEVLQLKRQPRFYCPLPDDEVDYAMFLLEAKLAGRDCAPVIDQSARLPVRKGKKHAARLARRAGCLLQESSDFDTYWRELLEPRLAAKYGIKPVHTSEEIRRLAAAFPRNIRLFIASTSGRLQAGVVVFETPTVAHLQYSALAMRETGSGALDYLTEWLIGTVYAGKAFFDFGICNEDHGRWLNHGLLRSKEGFGARSLVHDFYVINTSAHPRLAEVLVRIDSVP
jgi:hypothetical protein